jgi:hypothetical protein
MLLRHTSAAAFAYTVHCSLAPVPATDATTHRFLCHRVVRLAPAPRIAHFCRALMFYARVSLPRSFVLPPSAAPYCVSAGATSLRGELYSAREIPAEDVGGDVSHRPKT